MPSAVFGQPNGLGLLFHSVIRLRMSSSGSVTLRWAGLRSLRLVSSANKRSTRFSQDELVGVNCGSALSLHVSTRLGPRPKARQIRDTQRRRPLADQLPPASHVRHLSAAAEQASDSTFPKITTCNAINESGH